MLDSEHQTEKIGDKNFKVRYISGKIILVRIGMPRLNPPTCLKWSRVTTDPLKNVGTVRVVRADGGLYVQTSADKDSDSPDSSVSSVSSRTDRQTAVFLKFRTESGHLTESR